LQRTYFRTPHTTLTLEGTVASSAAWDTARSDDLRKWIARAVARGSADGHAQPASKPPEPVGLGGQPFAATPGIDERARLTGQLGENLRYRRTTLRTLRTQLTLARLELLCARDGCKQVRKAVLNST
jgi:hypothetical protein